MPSRPPARPNEPKDMEPFQEGKFEKGGRNPRPMTPRPHYVSLPEGIPYPERNGSGPAGKHK